MTHANELTPALTRLVRGAGCAAKLAPGLLSRTLCGLDLPIDANLLVGLDRADDAGVYKVSDELALVQTVDFFPPMVDDPYIFGQIAAANALSDVYAMGAVPKTAMNIVAFPSNTLAPDILRAVIDGGLSKLREAGVVLVGGHSVDDPELKYGLSVTGYIHPDKILAKRTLQCGDVLLLTKPLGTGIVLTAANADLVPSDQIESVISYMSTLNRVAASLMSKFSVHACTDITGFGFLGHLAEMVVDSGFGVEIDAAHIPVYDGALHWASMGLVPAGAYNNSSFRGAYVNFSPDVSREMQDVLFDPQTSGGLLISVASNDADLLLADLHNSGIMCAAKVGTVVTDHPDIISVVNSIVCEVL